MDYNKQARDFLASTGSTLTISRVPEMVQRAPLWDGPHGNEYRIKLARGDKEYTFSFWDSLHNKENRKRPSEYAVLACLNDYVGPDMTVEDYANEYGFTVEKRGELSRLLQSFALSQEQTRALREMYNVEELQALNDIA